MTEQEQKAIFAKNLNHYIYKSGKQQKEIAKALGFSVTTFNTWCRGKILPGMGKIQKIADYFGIEKTDLIDDKTGIDFAERFDRELLAAYHSAPTSMQDAVCVLLGIQKEQESCNFRAG